MIMIQFQTNQLFSLVGDRPDAPNVALVFTDGNSNIGQDKTVPMSIEAREKGIHIIVFGVSLWQS